MLNSSSAELNRDSQKELFDRSEDPGEDGDQDLAVIAVYTLLQLLFTDVQVEKAGKWYGL